MPQKPFVIAVKEFNEELKTLSPGDKNELAVLMRLQGIDVSDPVIRVEAAVA